MGSDFENLNGMNAGEWQLYRAVKRYESGRFMLIPNAIFERMGDGTNQIDMIVICSKGIFVLEMKDFKGWIFGNEHHSEWTQSLRGKGRKSTQHKFRNPIKQNENHIKTLKRVLALRGLDNLPVYNVVVFGSEATLKGIEASTDVVLIDNVDSVFEKYHDLNITDETIAAIHDHLASMMLTGENAMADHLRYVQGLASGSFSDSEPAPHYQEGASSERVAPQDQPDSRDSRTWRSVDSYQRRECYPRRKKRRPFPLRLALTFVFFIWLFGQSGRINKPAPPVIPPTQTVIPPATNPSTPSVSSPGGTAGGQTTSPTQATTPPVTENSPPPKTQTNESVVSQEPKVFLAIGMTDQDVLDLLGKPDRVDENSGTVWYYSLASVSFDQNDRVNGWNNFQGKLNTGMMRPVAGATPIDIGSSREAALDALGSPEKIEPGKYGIWYYSLASVSFDQNDRVNGWNNFQGKLNTGMMRPVAGAEPIDIGSSRQAALDALGSPEKIEPGEYGIWYYSLASVSFDQNGLVNGWNNFQGKLNTGMMRPVAGATPIDIGSTREAALDALGSPEKIEPGKYGIWYYSLASVSFDQNGLVNGWNNFQGKLNSGMMTPVAGAAPIDIGSSREAALNALGSPEKIEPGKYGIWYYSLASVSFDQNGLVNGWNNFQGKLNSGMMRPAVTDTLIQVGSDKTTVKLVLGSPGQIDASSPNLWYYGLAYLAFDANGAVVSWRDHNNTLSGKVSN